MSLNNNTKNKLEELQSLLIDNLIEELKSGDTRNIAVANSLLTSNKIVVKNDDGENQHTKIKKIMKRNEK